jgi:glyoxylase-like metal-dependent hydrolase (beta-lactamase superfamily II)
MISVKKFTFNPFQENTYILFDDTKECVIVDPGCYTFQEKNELKQYVASESLIVKKVISTHSHIDHVLGNAFVTSEFKVPLVINKEDLDTLNAIPSYAPSYGFTDYEAYSGTPEFFNLEEGVSFGNSTLKIVFVPGHAPGHVVFISHKDKFVINGDCLFYGSIGRTDLPGGDHNTLINSIKTKLFTLPNDYKVYCGHGPETTIGFEKLNNPFLQ